jgi:hypothetical protein
MRETIVPPVLQTVEIAPETGERSDSVRAVLGAAVFGPADDKQGNSTNRGKAGASESGSSIWGD